MKKWIRDWRRGWSDDDLANALGKIALQSVDPGALIYLTGREMRALVAYHDGYRLSPYWPTVNGR